MQPKVSVIIPNYNHAKYLAQRIESVLNQTIEEIEVIILDDCSLDNSREVIEQYARQDSRIRVDFNQQNSGSTFMQWNKGIKQATGKYVWIAESDDYADLRFLEVLVTVMEFDHNIGIVYCDSWEPDQDGRINTDDVGYLHWAYPEQWAHNFTLPGIDMVRKYMSFINIIPNASGVVVRRSLLEKVGPAEASCRLVGDWVYWARLLSRTRVAFFAEKLNYFRHHKNNVRSKITAGVEIQEVSYAMSQMQQYGAPDKEVYQRAMQRNLEWWFHTFVYGQDSAKTHLAIYENFSKTDRFFSRKFFKKAVQILIANRFSGLKQIIGDKLLKRNKTSRV